MSDLKQRLPMVLQQIYQKKKWIVCKQFEEQALRSASIHRSARAGWTGWFSWIPFVGPLVRRMNSDSRVLDVQLKIESLQVKT